MSGPRYDGYTLFLPDHPDATSYGGQLRDGTKVFSRQCLGSESIVDGSTRPKIEEAIRKHTQYSALCTRCTGHVTLQF
jgi:hypothetical protein